MLHFNIVMLRDKGQVLKSVNAKAQRTLKTQIRAAAIGRTIKHSPSLREGLHLRIKEKPHQG